MTTRLRSIVVGALLALAAFPATTARADTGLPIDLLARLFFKIATYDQSLPPTTLRIGVAHPAGDANGPAAVQAFHGLMGMKVNGRSLELVAIPYANPAQLSATVSGKALYGVFVTAAATDADLDALRTAAKKAGTFTFAQDAAKAERAATAGVATEGDKRVIIVNLTIALEQGRKYDGNFLKACKVVK